MLVVVLFAPQKNSQKRGENLLGLLNVTSGWVYTKVQDQRNPKLERSYWARENFQTQGAYIRVLVQSMKKWSEVANAASLSYKISLILIQQNSLNFEKPIFKLGVQPSVQKEGPLKGVLDSKFLTS